MLTKFMNVNTDSSIQILDYLNVYDLYQFITVNLGTNFLYKNLKKMIIINLIIREGYSINYNQNHLTLKKNRNVISLEKKINIDENLVRLILEKSIKNSADDFGF